MLDTWDADGSGCLEKTEYEKMLDDLGTPNPREDGWDLTDFDYIEGGLPGIVTPDGCLSKDEIILWETGGAFSAAFPELLATTTTTTTTTTATTSTTNPKPMCIDRGCSDQFNGRGKCVDFHHNKWSWIEANYNISESTPSDNQYCMPSRGLYPDPARDCCFCLPELEPPQRQCSDQGCEAKGGKCVNLLESSFNIASQMVDLNQRFNEDGLCYLKPNKKHCCDCYRLK